MLQHNPIVITSTTRLSLLSERDCHRHATRLSSPVQPDCYHYENQIVNAVKPDCHRQHNTIVIANTTRLSSPTQPDCHHQYNRIVIAIRTRLSSPARCLSSTPTQCALHLPQPSGVLRCVQSGGSILVGF